MMKVCHITSVHNRYDTRIFYKECTSLVKAGYNVTLLVADGKADETRNGVNITAIDFKPKNRIDRILHSGAKLLDKALDIDAEIYHLHDPELLLLGRKLIQQGKKVIFDSHEDYVSTIIVKQYIPMFLRGIAKNIYLWFERNVCTRCHGLIVCYHWTKDRYLAYCKNTELVLNYPVLENKQVLSDMKSIGLLYAGGISRQWNHGTVIDALSEINLTRNIKYTLIGAFSDVMYKEELQASKGWMYVDTKGKIAFENVIEYYSHAIIGVALLDYIPQCKGTIGNLSNTKLFEYMQYGIPVIATDFKLWKEVIEGSHCGICINPHDVNAFVNAVNYLLDHPEEAKKMGENGAKAVREMYNWGSEEKKLLKLYKNITDKIGEKKND